MYKEVDTLKLKQEFNLDIEKEIIALQTQKAVPFILVLKMTYMSYVLMRRSGSVNGFRR